MIAATQLRVVLVTPETTLLDEPVKSLQFPLFDGQMGILPGRTPMVGRLGIGDLILQTEQGERKYFVDGGFAQIKGSVVTLLTHRAIPADKISIEAAEKALAAANALRPRTDEEFDAKAKEIERARKQLGLRHRMH